MPNGNTREDSPSRPEMRLYGAELPSIPTATLPFGLHSPSAGHIVPVVAGEALDGHPSFDALLDLLRAEHLRQEGQLQQLERENASLRREAGRPGKDLSRVPICSEILADTSCLDGTDWPCGSLHDRFKPMSSMEMGQVPQCQDTGVIAPPEKQLSFTLPVPQPLPEVSRCRQMSVSSDDSQGRGVTGPTSGVLCARAKQNMRGQIVRHTAEDPPSRPSVHRPRRFSVPKVEEVPEKSKGSGVVADIAHRRAEIHGEDRVLFDRVTKLHKWFESLDRERKGFLTPKRLSSITARVVGESRMVPVAAVEKIISSIMESRQALDDQAVAGTIAANEELTQYGSSSGEDESRAHGVTPLSGVTPPSGVTPRSSTSDAGISRSSKSFACNIEIDAVEELITLLSKKAGGSTVLRTGAQMDADSWVPTMSFRIFVYLLLADSLLDWVPLEYCGHAERLRSSLVRHSADLLVAHYAHLTLPDTVVRPSRFLRVLDGMSGIVILINGLTIGIAEDMEWSGFDQLEYFFLFFFAFELCAKIFISGLRDTFSGCDRKWNWFDLFIIVLALFDLIMSQLAQAASLGAGEIAFLRLARLARLTRLMRLLRVLRLRIFKELMLMIKGVVAGLRTLLWAIVLLILIVYGISVLLRQTVGMQGITFADQYNTVLFDSIDSTMFMVFRLFLSDGSLPDGTPVVGHLYAHYGAVFMVPYMLCLLFIVFGIFNLITAVFVENVMESARQKKNLTMVEERVRVAEKLRELVLLLSRGATQSEGDQLTGETAMLEKRRACGSVWQKAMFVFNPMAMSTDNWRLSRDRTSGGGGSTEALEVEGQLTRDMFQEAILNPKVDELLDDLEVHIADRSELFDVLDADGSGSIDISELIAGLMKMRSGGADKSDSVATVLGVRAIQNQLRDMQKAVDNLDQKFEATPTVLEPGGIPAGLNLNRPSIE